MSFFKVGDFLFWTPITSCMCQTIVLSRYRKWKQIPIFLVETVRALWTRPYKCNSNINGAYFMTWHSYICHQQRCLISSSLWALQLLQANMKTNALRSLYILVSKVYFMCDIHCSCLVSSSVFSVILVVIKCNVPIASACCALYLSFISLNDVGIRFRSSFLTLHCSKPTSEYVLDTSGHFY